MIKLIRKGRAKEKQIECGFCNSLFSFEINDVIKTEVIKYPELNSHTNENYILQCPACQKKLVYEYNPFYGKEEK